VKVLGRKYYRKSKSQITSTWVLDLDCGHTKLLRANSANYARAEVVRNTLCDVCDNPKKKNKPTPKKLQQLATYIIENNL
jgi:hypothetical protein